MQRDRLFASLGKSYTDEEFDELCFECGVELDEITNEREEAEKMGATAEQLKALSTATVYKIDVPANRYDLLCNEGLSRAIRIFLGEQDAPVYELKEVRRRRGSKGMERRGGFAPLQPVVACKGLILTHPLPTPKRHSSACERQARGHDGEAQHRRGPPPRRVRHP